MKTPKKSESEELNESYRETIEQVLRNVVKDDHRAPNETEESYRETIEQVLRNVADKNNSSALDNDANLTSSVSKRKRLSLENGDSPITNGTEKTSSPSTKKRKTNSAKKSRKSVTFDVNQSLDEPSDDPVINGDHSTQNGVEEQENESPTKKIKTEFPRRRSQLKKPVIDMEMPLPAAKGKKKKQRGLKPPFNKSHRKIAPGLVTKVEAVQCSEADVAPALRQKMNLFNGKLETPNPSVIQSDIEKLEEELRSDKRIRPPYGKPYSVTGEAYYIAAGFLKDLENLLTLFEDKPNMRFVSFSDCWRSMGFSQIYRGRQTFKELLEFSEETVMLCKKFLDDVHSMAKRIGAFYTLYGLYYRHPNREHFAIRFTPTQYEALCQLIASQPHLINPDPGRLLIRLHMDSAIHHVATEEEMCIGLQSTHSTSNVELEYGYLRLAHSSHVQRALPQLDLEEALMRKYVEVKEKCAPNTAQLCLLPPDTSALAQQELEALQQATSQDLAFKGGPPSEKQDDGAILRMGPARYTLRDRAKSITAAEARRELEARGGAVPREGGARRFDEEATNEEAPYGSEHCISAELRKKLSHPKRGVSQQKIEALEASRKQAKRGKQRHPISPRQQFSYNLHSSLMRVKQEMEISDGLISLAPECTAVLTTSADGDTATEVDMGHNVEMEVEGSEVPFEPYDIPKTALELTVQLKVNGKKETKKMRANISMDQLKQMKDYPEKIQQLCDNLAKTLAPKFRPKYGRNCVLTELSIVKAAKAKTSDNNRVEDFMTGFEPLVKSGSSGTPINLNRRMKMLKAYTAKTPIKPQVEEFDKSQDLRVTVKTVLVNGKLKHVQHEENASKVNQPDLPLNDALLATENHQVVRNHNCNWNQYRNVTHEFRDFRYELNKNKFNEVSIPSFQRAQAIRRGQHALNRVRGVRDDHNAVKYIKEEPGKAFSGLKRRRGRPTNKELKAIEMKKENMKKRIQKAKAKANQPKRRIGRPRKKKVDPEPVDDSENIEEGFEDGAADDDDTLHHQDDDNDDVLTNTPKIEKLKFEDINAKLEAPPMEEETTMDDQTVNLSQLSNEWEDTSETENKHVVLQHTGSDRRDDHAVQLFDDHTLFSNPVPSLYEDPEESVEVIDDDVNVVPSTSGGIDYSQPQSTMCNFVPNNQFMPMSHPPWSNVAQNASYCDNQQTSRGFGNDFNSQFITRNSMEPNYPAYPPPPSQPILGPFEVPLQQGKYIKASFNGTESTFILPLGTEFSVCDASVGSETNSTTLDFDASQGAPIMLNDNSSPRSEDVILIEQGQPQNMLQPPPLPPLHPPPMTSSYQQSQNIDSSVQPINQHQTSQYNYLSSLNLKPASMQLPHIPVATSHSDNVGVSDQEPSVVYDSPRRTSSRKHTPSRKLRDLTAKQTPEKITTRRRNARSSNQATSSPPTMSSSSQKPSTSNEFPSFVSVQQPITWATPEESLRSHPGSAPVTAPHHRAQTTLTNSPNRLGSFSSSISSPKEIPPGFNTFPAVPTTAPMVEFPPHVNPAAPNPLTLAPVPVKTPSTLPRKAVCSFLVSAKSRALKPALKAMGVASGKAPTPATPPPRKVSFFRRGSLGKAPR